MSRSIGEYGTFGSFKVGTLPEGCKRCLRGEKIVLYVTGKCTVGCYYCPIQEDRRNEDAIFVNERKLINELDLFDENEKCLATGAGITGGDPLETPKRTLEKIKTLKKKYGNNYHVHLYTSGMHLLKNPNLADLLFEAGLDELRIHPKNLRTFPVWKLAASIKTKYPDRLIGFEVPAIPHTEEELEKLILFADENGLDFVNLNEFEFTEANFKPLQGRGFVSVLHNSAVVSSRETAWKVIEKVKDKTKIPLHFCSSGSKDGIQLKQRYRRRAKQVKRPFEFVSEEGLLEFARLTVFNGKDWELLKTIIEEDLEIPQDMYEIREEIRSIDIADVVAVEIIEDLRQMMEVQGELISVFPITDSPIIRSDPF